MWAGNLQKTYRSQKNTNAEQIDNTYFNLSFFFFLQNKPLHFSTFSKLCLVASEIQQSTQDMAFAHYPS